MSNYVNNRLKSFKYAFQGIVTLFRETPNAAIHLVLAILAVLLGFILSISPVEWIAICIVIGLVFALEAVNTALENLSDFACNKETHPAIKKAKDLGAASVLLAAIAAFIVGLIVFLPKLISLI